MGYSLGRSLQLTSSVLETFQKFQKLTFTIWGKVKWGVEFTTGNSCIYATAASPSETAYNFSMFSRILRRAKKMRLFTVPIGIFILSAISSY